MRLPPPSHCSTYSALADTSLSNHAGYLLDVVSDVIPDALVHARNNSNIVLLDIVNRWKKTRDSRTHVVGDA